MVARGMYAYITIKFRYVHPPFRCGVADPAFLLITSNPIERDFQTPEASKVENNTNTHTYTHTAHLSDRSEGGWRMDN